MATFTARQRLNIQRGYHPDCCLQDPCSACGASEAVGGGECAGAVGGTAARLWQAAIRHEHNNDPERVLQPVGFSDAEVLDEAARIIFSRCHEASA